MELREVIERLYKRLPRVSTSEIEELKERLLKASEEGPQGLEEYFQKEVENLVKQAKTLYGQLSKMIEG